MKHEAPSVFAVKGMHCAACANIIERTVRKLDGITDATANYGTESLSLTLTDGGIDASRIRDVLKPLGYELVIPEPKTASTEANVGTDPGLADKLAEVGALRNKVIVSVPLIAVSAGIMAWDLAAAYGLLPGNQVISEFFHHLLPLMATYMLFVVGLPYLKGLFRFVRYGAANMDTLIGLGTSVAFLYSFVLTAFEEPLSAYLDTSHTYYDVTIIVVGFITLGKFLEARAKLRTGDAIRRLLGLQAKSALVLRDGIEREIPIGEVVVGDELMIRPGTKVPVDGVVVSGSSFVDESMVSGEPLPVGKSADASLIGGTMNTTGSLTMRATKVGADTVLAGIVRMVEAAQGSKAPVQALADRISAIFVPVVLVIGVAALGSWLFFGVPALGFDTALSFGLASFVGVLVIACPCALGLATPTAIIVSVGKGAANGILVKDAASLEKLAGVDTVVVDKTGTLTIGKPELSDVVVYSDRSPDDVLAVLAALERHSEHPIAHAISVAARERSLELPIASGFEVIEGRGIRATIDGTEYFAGSPLLMTSLALTADAEAIETGTKQGKTPVLLASKSAILALAWVGDKVKPDAAKAVADLRSRGLKVVMLTGDSEHTARHVAAQVGIDTVVAEVLPQEKLAYVKSLQSEGHRVAVAGDGINDAPALAQADVGIAMGSGTDVAIETAGLTLLNGDISKLAKAVHLARQTMTGIRQNLFWAFAFNLIGIPLAAGALYVPLGWLLSPAFAGAAMAFSSVAVVSNSLRLKLKAL